MKNPFFSVIIPTLNRCKLIQRCIGSVLNQTFTDFELIIVDDGSTDNTKEIISGLKDSRIRYFYQENRGRSAARNYGVKCANSQNIIFLDSDDEAQSEWLDWIARELTPKEVGIVCCGYVDREEQNHPANHETIFLPKKSDAMYRNHVVLFRPPGTFALRREIFESVNGYAENLAYSENTELAWRLVRCCLEKGLEIRSVLKPLLIYHRRASRIPKTEREYQVLLDSAEFILNYHQEELKKVAQVYADYNAIAGVNSYRLGNFSKSRQYFLSAIRNHPEGFSNYMRYLLTFVPVLARKVWLRTHNASES